MKNGGLTVRGVEERLRKYNGNMAAVAREYGVTRQAVWKFVQSYANLAAVVIDCRESMKDHAESSLHKSVLEGEAWAVCFYLKTQAKDRGYVERQEVFGETTNRLVIEEEVVGDDHQEGPTPSDAGALP